MLGSDRIWSRELYFVIEGESFEEWLKSRVVRVEHERVASECAAAIHLQLVTSVSGTTASRSVGTASTIFVPSGVR
jgi:hypothetical protein